MKLGGGLEEDSREMLKVCKCESRRHRVGYKWFLEKFGDFVTGELRKKTVRPPKPEQAGQGKERTESLVFTG